LASREVEAVIRAHRDLIALAFQMRAPDLMTVIERPTRRRVADAASP
jgi:hypothetical protein